MRFLLLLLLAGPASAAAPKAVVVRTTFQPQLNLPTARFNPLESATLPKLSVTPLLLTPKVTLNNPGDPNGTSKTANTGEPIYLKLDKALKEETPAEVTFDKAEVKKGAAAAVDAPAAEAKTNPAPLKRSSAFKKSAKIAAVVSAAATPLAMTMPELREAANLPFIIGFYIGFFVPIFIASFGVIFVFRGFKNR